MKKVLITDLDDTLYDWLGFFIPSFYAMVDELVSITGIDKGTLLSEYKEKHQYYGTVEHPFVTLELPSIKNKYNAMDSDQIKVILSEACHRFNSVRKQELNLFPYVKQTLEKLYNNGITIIGFTESTQEAGFYRLKKLGIDVFFQSVYVSVSSFDSKFEQDQKIHTIKFKKPNKDVLLEICQDENLSVSDVVYVGDSLTKDVYMAKMAGITSVWAKYEKKQNDFYQKLVDITSWTDEDFTRESTLKKEWNEKNLSPDYCISNYSELLPLFDIREEK